MYVRGIFDLKKNLISNLPLIFNPYNVYQDKLKNKEVNKMTKQDNAAILFGIGLNVLVVVIAFIGATNYIA